MKTTVIMLLILSVTCRSKLLAADAAVGTVTLDGKVWNQIALRPVIPVWKFGVALDLIVYIDQDGNIHKDEWNFSNPKAIKNTIIDKIYYIRYGQPGQKLYARIGALTDITLGYGILVQGYSNAIQYPQVRKIGLNVTGRSSQFRFEGFINDFKENIGLFGGRVRTTVFGGLPVGVSVVVDRNQFLGLKDNDDDGRPDLLDDFPYDKDYWLDTDGDGFADSDPLEWDIDGDNLTDFLGPHIPGIGYDSLVVLDSNIIRKEEPFNIRKQSNSVSGMAVDVGYPVINNSKFTVSVYAQAAKLMGETTNPETGESESLGSGLIPMGVSARFGPARLNLEYRMVPRGNFEFNYWNQVYELERSRIAQYNTITTKETHLGRFGQQAGIYGALRIDIGTWIGATVKYQNMSGENYNMQAGQFVSEHNQNIEAILKLNKSISKIKNAQLFYQQRNVPNPFKFEFSESTLLGYRLGIEVNSGMILFYHFQRSFVDINGDGDVQDNDETINLMTFETSFSL